ncbi:MAG: MBL fold metallo-hydrolase [Opitutales bacterium]
MKPAYQKDDALLADIEQARKRGESKVWWLGQSGFLVVTAQGSILFDPYLSDSLTRKYADTDKPHVRVTEQVIDPARLTGIDVITSSHNHTDHLDADTLLPLLDANPQAKLVCPRANRAFILERLGEVSDRLVTMNAGESTDVAGILFHGITAAHNTLDRDDEGNCKFMGFVVQLAGITLYFSGDTLRHEGLAESLKPFAPDVAFLPINGNKPERRVAGNLNGEEAAALGRDIEAKLLIPHHFDMFAFNTADPAIFENACQKQGQACRSLRHGEGMTL